LAKIKILFILLKEVIKMLETIEKDTERLINLQRFAHLLLSLTPSEVETLEILVDKDAISTISKSIKEFDRGEGIFIDEW
jgi:hypothetical protein